MLYYFCFLFPTNYRIEHEAILEPWLAGSGTWICLPLLLIICRFAKTKHVFLFFEDLFDFISIFQWWNQSWCHLRFLPRVSFEACRMANLNIFHFSMVLLGDDVMLSSFSSMFSLNFSWWNVCFDFGMFNFSLIYSASFRWGATACKLKTALTILWSVPTICFSHCSGDLDVPLRYNVMLN